MEEQPKYDAMTGEKLEVNKIPGWYLAVGIIATLVIPLVGILIGLYAIIKGHRDEGIILLAIGLFSWMLWIYVL